MTVREVAVFRKDENSIYKPGYRERAAQVKENIILVFLDNAARMTRKITS